MLIRKRRHTIRPHFAHRRRRPYARLAMGAGAAVLAVALVVLISMIWPGSRSTVDAAGTTATSGQAPVNPCHAGQPVPAVGCVLYVGSVSPPPTCPPPTATPAATPPGCPPAPPAPSASASPTPSASPTVTPTPPSDLGPEPGPSNTGVPAGTKLTVVTGDQVYKTAGQVISGLDIHGFVQIRAKNVTIKDSIIRGGPNPACNSALIWVRADAQASAVIEDSEIVPEFPSPCVDGIWASNSVLDRLDIHGSVDGVKAFDNTTLENSYVHDLSWFAHDPNQGNNATHNDDVQTYQGNEHITLRHNTMSPGTHGNAAYQVTQDGGDVSTDLHVEDNWLDGGGCTLNFSSKGGPAPMTGIYVVDNRFGRHSAFNCPILVSTQTFLTENSGNVWDDTGKPIPAPQRHD